MKAIIKYLETTKENEYQVLNNIKKIESLLDIRYTLFENDSKISGIKKDMSSELENLISSTRFKALADKTQVHLPKFEDRSEYRNVLVSNRLSHSLQVSKIAVNLANRLNYQLSTILKSKLSDKILNEVKSKDIFLKTFINDRIQEKFEERKDIINLQEIEYISEIHDLGHFPFGHMGEEIADEVFKKYGVRCEGNASNIRVARENNLIPNERILYGILKYPWELKGEKKKGVYVEDWKYVKSIIKNTQRRDKIFFSQFGINEKKIPNLYMQIMEHSDDIAYLTQDMEDAILYFNINFDTDEMDIGYEPIENILKSINIKKLKNTSSSKIKESISELRKLLISNIRINEDLSIEFKNKEIDLFMKKLRTYSKENYYDKFKDPEYKNIFKTVIEHFVENINNEDFLLENIKSKKTKWEIINSDSIDRKLEILRDYIGEFTNDYMIAIYKKIERSEIKDINLQNLSLEN